MKKSGYLLFVILFSAVMLWSCEKEVGIEDAEIDEIAEDIASALGTSNSGISSEVTSLGSLAGEYDGETSKASTIDTVYEVETSFSKSSQEGAIITYSYSYQLEYGFVFEDYLLHHVYYNSDISGSYDAPRIASSETRTNNWVLTGLQLTSSEYILNGVSERTGNTQSKIGNMSQIVTSSSITLLDITIDKSTLLITGGTLNWTVEGTLNDKSFSYDAVIVYQGDDVAQLTLNGNTYSIDITAGEIEE